MKDTCRQCGHTQDIKWDTCKKCGYTAISKENGLHSISEKPNWEEQERKEKINDKIKIIKLENKFEILRRAMNSEYLIIINMTSDFETMKKKINQLNERITNLEGGRKNE